MSYQLAIDTATGVNVGLAKDHIPLLAKTEQDSRSHAELTMPMVNQLLDEAGITTSQLTEIVVGLGPGPFTGLRVGIVTAATIAELVNAKFIGVCTLDAIALSYISRYGAMSSQFVVVTDARRKEVYWARYSGDAKRIDEPQVSSPDEVSALPAIGPGTQVYSDIFADRLAPNHLQGLDASVMAAQASLLANLGSDPIYLRKPDITMPTTRKSTLASRRIAL